MSLKLLVCLSLSLFAVEAVPNPKIEAEEGENVSLRCLMDPPVDVSDSTVEWSKDGRANIVHLYIDGRDRAGDQKKAFTNRTVLFHEGLTRGNVTLQLSHVKLSDNGTYRCYIVRWKTYCYTVLEVVKKGQLSRSQRNDSSTTRPSLDEVPKPDDPDGENRGVVCVDVFFQVSGIFCVVLLAVIGTICGTVWFYRKVQGRRGRRTEVTANGAEMQNLRSVGRDAESGSGNDQPEEQTERRTN